MSRYDDGVFRPIVTGASSGLGRAAAAALADAGADVAVLAGSVAALDDTVAELRAAGRRALAVSVDLALAGAITDAVTRAVEELGPVDVLVSAAGTDVPFRSPRCRSRTGTAC
jgi:NADP-dependent 3-hydroxy acid dehydrogenase YdfG